MEVRASVRRAWRLRRPALPIEARSQGSRLGRVWVDCAEVAASRWSRAKVLEVLKLPGPAYKRLSRTTCHLRGYCLLPSRLFKVLALQKPSHPPRPSQSRMVAKALLAILNGEPRLLLPGYPHYLLVDKVIAKVGLSKDPKQREHSLNQSFPEASYQFGFQWRVVKQSTKRTKTILAPRPWREA